MSVINDKLKAYRAGLKLEMKNSQWWQIPIWAPMIGHIAGMKGKYPESVPLGAVQSKTLRPTGMPIEVLTDLRHMGGHELDIPMILPLRKKAIYGDKNAEGQEEDRDWVYLRSIINQVRKAAKTRDGMMGELALHPKLVARIWKNMKDEFVDYNRRWQGYAPYDAAYRGHSDNILAPKADGGLGHVILQASHPNFYVAGQGKVTWSDTAATYESNVATALDNLTSADVMNTQVIRNAKLLGGRHRITPVMVAGKKVTGVMVINDAQASQLFDDDLFTKVAVALVQKNGEDSPFLTGEVYLWEGVLLLVDMNNPGIWTNGDSSYDSTRGTINYGVDNPMDNPIMETDRKLAIYFGASFILCGHTVPLGFKNRSDDYDNVRGEASYTVVGYNRADRYDNDGFLGTGKFIENTSSLAIATYSPNTPSWSNSES